MVIFGQKIIGEQIERNTREYLWIKSTLTSPKIIYYECDQSYSYDYIGKKYQQKRVGSTAVNNQCLSQRISI